MGLFGLGDEIIIRDSATGESHVFQPTAQGYRDAAQFRERIASQGHVASDDHTGSLGRLHTVYPESY